MVKRERRKPAPGEFEDPLSNYDPPVYADELEESLCEDAVTAIEHQPFSAMRGEQTVREVLAHMSEENVACVVLVDDDNKPTGVFSERDVLNRVMDHYAELADHPVDEVMTHDPVVVYPTDTPARVLNVMVTGGFRHVPLVDADRRLIGVIGARRTTDYLQRYFTDIAGL